MSNSVLLGGGLNSFRHQFGGKTEHAIAELVDNSIQWRSKERKLKVRVTLLTDAVTKNIIEIHTADNGVGMDKPTLDVCLSFGGGKNIGTTETGKLGKFGLGLPYSSCSQSTRYEVVSWQNGGAVLKSVSRDHNDYGFTDPVGPAHSSSYEVDKKFQKLHREFLDEKSGTIVVWDRVDQSKVPARAETLMNHLDHFLGRVYRGFIVDGTLNLEVVHVIKSEIGLQVNTMRSIKLNDPLFAEVNNCLPEPWNAEETNHILKFHPKRGQGDDLDTPGQKTFKYAEDTPQGKIEHEIVVRHTIVKRSVYEEKRGAKARSDRFASLYNKNSGISLMRAGRELKLSWFNFPRSGFSEAHRWYGIEVRFEPQSDRLMGVQANKLDAVDFRYISDEVIEYEGQISGKLKFLHEISTYISALMADRIKEIKSWKEEKNRIKCDNCEIGYVQNGKCDNCNKEFEFCVRHPKVRLVEGICAACNLDHNDVCFYHQVSYVNGKCPDCPEREPLSPEDKDQVRIYLGTLPEYRSKPELIEESILELERSNNSHFFLYTSLPGSNTLLDYELVINKFYLIMVNKEHVFYEKAVKKILDLDGGSHYVEPIKYLFGAIIHLEVEMKEDQGVLYIWRGNLGTKLQNILSAYALNET